MISVPAESIQSWQSQTFDTIMNFMYPFNLYFDIVLPTRVSPSSLSLSISWSLSLSLSPFFSIHLSYSLSLSSNLPPHSLFPSQVPPLTLQWPTKHSRTGIDGGRRSVENKLMKFRFQEQQSKLPLLVHE